MKRFVILGLAVILAACSSSSAPKDVFTGTWSGTVNVDSSSLTIATVTSQTGSAVSGTCSTSGSIILTCNLTGTSNPPSLALTMSFSDSEVVVFTGNYVTRDSVAGILTEHGDTIAGFGFKKQ
jgi:hypothetical protein